MPRNLVFCCDGTANEYGSVNTNVVHLYQRLAHDPERQIACYEPGVGTFCPFGADDGGRTGRLLGKLFAHGLTENIENGYRFLMRHYRPGDRVYLFGFSRGAYAVRALAGMVRKCGLLPPGQENLVRKATRLYNGRANEEIAEGFRTTYARDCPVHLIGVWDTVSSLGYLYGKRRFFDATLGEDVRFGYHALAIDERRPKFEHLPWKEPRDPDHQTIEQVWFAGAHADVGGGYEQRGLAEISLQWMIARAAAQGLMVDDDTTPKHDPDPGAPMHYPWKSLPGRVLKWLHFGERPRGITEGSWVHETAEERMRVASYAPDVLPGQYHITET